MTHPAPPPSTRWTAAFGLAAVLVGVISACSGDEGANPTAETDRTCTEGQAIAIAPYVGTSLGAKKLALTFDDGPASRTAELSTYLKSEGIPAAFFVNGRNLANHPGVLAKLVADGHIVGNHTQDHRNLTDLAVYPYGPAGKADMVSQLAATDTLIAPFVTPKHLLFRAPYGSFDLRAAIIVASSPMSKYVGHVHWDIGGARSAKTAADWACWQETPHLTTKVCGDLYVDEIAALGRGIVLMHDADYGNNANHDVATGRGNTVDMVKYFVPILKARGYTFVPLDAVPDIALALDPPPPSDAGADARADAAPDAPTAAANPAAPSALAPAPAATAAPSPCPSVR